MCRTLSVKHHFEIKHKKTLKDQADKAESIKRAVSRYDEQASSLRVSRVPHCIANHWKPFMNGEIFEEGVFFLFFFYIIIIKLETDRAICLSKAIPIELHVKMLNLTAK